MLTVTPAPHLPQEVPHSFHCETSMIKKADEHLWVALIFLARLTNVYGSYAQLKAKLAVQNVQVQIPY